MGDANCKNLIDALEAEIEDLENNTTINIWVKKWLIAKYKRCLDRLKKEYVKIVVSDDREEEAITFLSQEEDFRYRVLAYMIMINNLEYSDGRTYLNNLQIANNVESDFVQTQNIYLDYLADRENYVLSSTNESFLLQAGQGNNPLSGYTRSLYYRLTGTQILLDLPHINGTTTPRNSGEVSEIEVYPNPSINGYVSINIGNMKAESSYKVEIYNNIGAKLKSLQLTNENTEIVLEGLKGLLFLKILEDGKFIHSQKIVSL